MIKYIELKSDFGDSGPAWIATIKESRSGSTIYFNQMSLKKGHGVSGNYFDFSNGNEYWISGIKQKGSNRHWAGSGKISVEKRAVEELLALQKVNVLNLQEYIVCENFPEPDIQELHRIENERL